MKRFDKQSGQMTRREFGMSLAAVAMAQPLIAQAPRRPIIKATTLNHVAFRVSDVARTSDWYQRMFGMPVFFRQDSPGAAGRVAILRVGSGPEFLALFPANGAKPGPIHFGLGVENFDKASIDKILAEHRVKGEWRARKAAGGDVPELIVRDPDNSVVQVQDARHCGGGGALGNVCPEMMMPKKDGAAPLPIRGINHVSYYVGNVENADRFCMGVFGLRLASYDFRQQEPIKILGIGTNKNPTQFLAPFWGEGDVRIHHYCLGVENWDNDKVVKTLAVLGQKVPAPPPTPRLTRPGCCGSNVEYPGGYSMSVSDPDGISVQLADWNYCAGSGKLGQVCTYPS